MPNPPSFFSFTIEAVNAGNRLDSVVSETIDSCSRSFAATLIRNGRITVDGKVKKPGYQVKAGETIKGKIDPPETQAFPAQDIDISILYEDDEVLVVNKAPGMVVHPAPGHSRDTLVNALMHHCPDLTGISGSLRPGIVHRLDKDTSGVLVVAKTSLAMQNLSDQFKSRSVSKRYLAIVYGVPEMDSGEINLPIGRHPMDRKKMSITTRTPRSALTLWHVRKRYCGACLLELDIRTGRTHQIRVHCMAMGHPVVGDPVYSSRGVLKRFGQENPEKEKMISLINRQMLHAWKLRIKHPVSESELYFKAPMPEDMALTLNRLEEN